MKEIADASMQAMESTVDVTPLQAATKIMAGMADGMAGMADGMVEWQTEMATYVLFMVHTDDTDDDDNDDEDDDDTF